MCTHVSEERQARLTLELSLLQKPVWHWGDIAKFNQCASAKAIELKKRAIENGGKIDYDKHGVQSRYVLALMGTTPEVEIKKRYIELTGRADPNESDQ